MKKTLRDNPWVQSPQWPSVQELLKKIDPSQSYYPRGSKKATKDLNLVEKTHREWVSSVMSLEEFPHCYMISGATEGINQWRMTDKRPWQFLEGDYMWPNLVSKDGVEVSLSELSKDKVLYLSNPSCRDGNFLSSKTIDKIESTGCPVILDCSYVGSTKLKTIDKFTATEQIIFSFSKGWGLIGQRVGLLYTKNPHPTLELMKKVECWNYQGVQIIQKILDNFGVDTIYKQAIDVQEEICKKYDLDASDSYFIGNSRDEYFEKRRRYGDIARLCLTPLWS